MGGSGPAVVSLVWPNRVQLFDFFCIQLYVLLSAHRHFFLSHFNIFISIY